MSALLNEFVKKATKVISEKPAMNEDSQDLLFSHLLFCLYFLFNIR